MRLMLMRNTVHMGNALNSFFTFNVKRGKKLKQISCYRSLECQTHSDG